MPTFRDEWQGMPNVVVVAETSITEQGVLEDALLFVLDETEPHVTLTDEHGAARLFTLPEQAFSGDFVGAGLDLTTEQPT